jgi:arsenate reductase (thioredoxin)
MGRKKKVLFVCGRNAARSQMAEGFLRALFDGSYEAASAGLGSSRVSRTAIRVMAEAGIDISPHRSKAIGEFAGEEFDVVATLCDEAACTPRHLLPRAGLYIHRAFPDPAGFTGREEEVLAAYREVRDGIRAWVREEFGPLRPPGPAGG